MKSDSLDEILAACGVEDVQTGKKRRKKGGRKEGMEWEEPTISHMDGEHSHPRVKYSYRH